MENYCLEHKGTYGSPITPPSGGIASPQNPLLATPHMITQNFTQAVKVSQNFTQAVKVSQNFLQAVENSV